MPELSKKSVALDLDAISPLEGVVVPNLNEVFESVRITSAQLSGIAEASARLVSQYSNFAIGLQGAMQQFAKSQQRIAEAMVKLSTNAALFDQIDIVIRSFPILEFPTLNFPVPKLQPVQIFVQPALSYTPPKALPLPKRKQKLPLTAINIEGNGFTINGEYIHMRTTSNPGKLLELFIRKDLAGTVSDSLIYETIGIAAKDYSAIGVVLHDLQDALAISKLKLNLKRDTGIRKYKAKAITQYIRMPKKKKKVAKTMQLN